MTRRTCLKVLGGPIAAASHSMAKMAEEATQREQLVTERRLVRWRTHLVGEIPYGYQVAVADVNGDGRLDILGLSSHESIVAWYENPSWKARLITRKTQKNISLAPLPVFDRAGSPRCGVALAADFALEDSLHGSLWWAEPASSLDAEWPLAPIGQIPSSHRLRWGDINGDGRLELIAAPLLGKGAEPPNYAIGASLTWFEPPDSVLRARALAEVRGNVSWKSHPIDNSLTVVHGIHVMDWDGDGRDEVLTASFEGIHLFHSEGSGANLRWTKLRLAEGDQNSRIYPGGTGQARRLGSSEIGVGKLLGRRFLAAIEPWHGEHVTVYSADKPGELWKRQVIDSSFHEGHALTCADLDGDGNDEIVAGFRGLGTSLYVYYATDSSGQNWEKQTLDSNMAASGITIADINGDDRLDVVAIGASTGNVKWYENLGTSLQ